MNKVLVSACNYYAGKNDIVIHVGDLLTYGKDRETESPKENPSVFLGQIEATFVNIEGNHDATNGVKSIALSMRLVLGKVFNVVLCHYPSTDPRSRLHLKPGDINICGHNHSLWNGEKFMVDKKNKVLNINVCTDLWDYQPVSEVTLVNYIKQILRKGMPI